MTETDVRAIAEAVAKAVHDATAGIIPERAYTPEEAARLCGWGEGKDPGRRFREATKGKVKVIPLTPGGQRIAYLGRDLIEFLNKSRAA